MVVNADMNSKSTEPTCELAASSSQNSSQAAAHWFIYVKKMFLVHL